MSKIRKGSIVWDKGNGEFTKVLNNPYKGELPDALVIKTGVRYHKIMKGMALCKGGDSDKMQFNNISCYLRRVVNLISRKEYLEIQNHLQIKNN